jgi:hypothetical protein
VKTPIGRLFTGVPRDFVAQIGLFHEKLGMYWSFVPATSRARYLRPETSEIRELRTLLSLPEWPLERAWRLIIRFSCSAARFA